MLALCVQLSFAALHVVVRPFASATDNGLAALAHFSLIVLYYAISLIKICDLGETACRTYGLGDVRAWDSNPRES